MSEVLRAIIIDDEQKGINSLRLLIEKYIRNVKVVAETTEAVKGVELIENYKPEIVFLDINMPHLNGFDVLQRVSHHDFNLIFTTAHKEYALKALKNNAIDYLLKPVDVEDLEKSIERVQNKQLEKKAPPDVLKVLSELNSASHKIPFHTKERVEYLDKDEIIRLESDSNYTHVYTTGGQKIVIAKTIGDYEHLLCGGDNKFMRVHQSHIINLNKVKRFLRDHGGIIVTSDDKQVPLSKNKKEDFIKWLNIR